MTQSTAPTTPRNYPIFTVRWLSIPALQRLEADPRSPHLPYRLGLKLALRLGSTGKPQQQKKRPLGTARRVRWWRGGRDQAEPTPT